MSAFAIHEVLSTPPPRIESPFELAALRITTGWLDTRTVSATAADLRLATDYMRMVGMTIEPLPGERQFRVVSEQGRETIVSREAALLAAIRCLALRESQRTSTHFIEHAA